MKRADPRKQAQLHARRQRVAYEAARLMAVHGVQDYQQAKRKAARQLGMDDEASLPDNRLVQEQLRDYQRLFRGDAQARELRLRREAALQAMAFFEPFQPRLVGSVLEGTADAHSAITLQVFTDESEAFTRFLADARMPTSNLRERRLRLSAGQSATFPSWHFEADGLGWEVTVLPMSLLRRAPLDAVDDRPMPRANATAVRQLLDSSP